MRIRRTGAFTLVELLVVVAIISILAAILLPVLGRARAQARFLTCNNQVKQWFIISLQYADDYRGRFMTRWSVAQAEYSHRGTLIPYADTVPTNYNNTIFKGGMALCPDARINSPTFTGTFYNSYAVNMFIGYTYGNVYSPMSNPHTCNQRITHIRGASSSFFWVDTGGAAACTDGPYRGSTPAGWTAVHRKVGLNSFGFVDGHIKGFHPNKVYENGPLGNGANPRKNLWAPCYERHW